MKSKTFLFAAGVLVALVVLAGIAYLALHKDGGPEGTTIPVSGEGTTTPNYTIEPVPSIDLKAIAPSLDRGVHFSASVPADVRVILQKEADDITARLKKDLSRADDWFDLGLVYHSANDYEGARDVWVFLTKVVKAPGSATAYDNLGKLYTFDLKDYAKSESYFKLSMSAEPASINPYLELHNLYRYLYKTDTSAAADILIAAAKKFPTNFDPLVLLGEYYRDMHETAKARDAFNKALAMARAANDVEHIESIGKELEQLPQ